MKKHDLNPLVSSGFSIILYIIKQKIIYIQLKKIIIYKMFDTIPQMPSYLDIKGENQNIFQINLDNSENSTRESHPECDSSKIYEEVCDSNKNEDLFLEPKSSMKNSTKKNFLMKKREIKLKKSKSNKNKSGKYKIIYKLFSDFKINKAFIKLYI